MHHQFEEYIVDVKWGGGGGAAEERWDEKFKGKPQHAIDIRLLALCDTI